MGAEELEPDLPCLTKRQAEELPPWLEDGRGRWEKRLVRQQDAWVANDGARHRALGGRGGGGGNDSRRSTERIGVDGSRKVWGGTGGEGRRTMDDGSKRSL